MPTARRQRLSPDQTPGRLLRAHFQPGLILGHVLSGLIPASLLSQLSQQPPPWDLTPSIYNPTNSSSLPFLEVSGPLGCLQQEAYWPESPPLPLAPSHDFSTQ